VGQIENMMKRRKILFIFIGCIFSIFAYFYVGSQVTKNLIIDGLNKCNQNMKGHNVNLCIKMLEQAYDRGSTEAPFYLGVLYENGKGPTVDFTKALHWYQQAANLGHQKSLEVIESPKYKELAYSLRYESNKPNQSDWFIKDASSNCYPPHKCIIQVSVKWRFSDEYIKYVHDQVFNSRTKTQMDYIELVLPCMSASDGWPLAYLAQTDGVTVSNPYYEESFYDVKNCHEYREALKKHVAIKKQKIIDLEDYDSFKLCGEFVKNKYGLMAYAIVGQHKPKLLKTKDNRRYVTISINISKNVMVRDEWKQVTCSTPLTVSEYQLYNKPTEIDLRLHQ
jgi:hypothetical protein